MIGKIEKKDIEICKEWLRVCCKLGDTHNFRETCPGANTMAAGYLLALEGDYFSKELFFKINEWFTGFANGIPGYFMDEEDPEMFQGLMHFTTNFCWTVAMYREEAIFASSENLIPEK